MGEDLMTTKRTNETKSRQRKTINERTAEQFSRVLGSMTVFWLVMLLLAAWISAQTLLQGFDRYPFGFLLFLTNLAQFLSIFVLQNTQNRQTAHLERLIEGLEREERELAATEMELVDEVKRRSA